MRSVSAVWTRRHLLALMVRQDMKTSYGRYRLGFVWALGEPFLLALLMWAVFTFIFAGGRGIGLTPFIVFLVTGIYPFTWLQLSNRWGPKSFRRYGRVLDISPLPLYVWPLRAVLFGLTQFILSLPVILFFVVTAGAPLTAYTLLFPVGIAVQFVLCLGLAMVFAGMSLRWPDVEMLVQILNRAFFWTSPIIWAQKNFPEWLQPWLYVNPFHGVLDMYRAAIWPQVLTNWTNYLISGGIILAIFIAGVLLLRFEGSRARRV